MSNKSTRDLVVGSVSLQAEVMNMRQIYEWDIYTPMLT